MFQMSSPEQGCELSLESWAPSLASSAESVSTDSGWETLASQGWWASSVLLMLQASAASHMRAGYEAKVGKGQPCLPNTDLVPDTVHGLPEFFLRQSYGVFAHSQRPVGVRGGIWTQISLPPRSFSHWIPCLIPKVPSNNIISTWKNGLMREYTSHRWRVKQRGSAQEVGPMGTDVADGTGAPLHGTCFSSCASSWLMSSSLPCKAFSISWYFWYRLPDESTLFRLDSFTFSSITLTWKRPSVSLGWDVVCEMATNMR